MIDDKLIFDFLGLSFDYPTPLGGLVESYLGQAKNRSGVVSKPFKLNALATLPVYDPPRVSKSFVEWSRPRADQGYKVESPHYAGSEGSKLKVLPPC